MQVTNPLPHPSFVSNHVLFSKTCILFHMDALGAALRLSLLLFSPAVNVVNEAQTSFVKPQQLQMENSTFENDAITKNSDASEKQSLKIKYYNQPNQLKHQQSHRVHEDYLNHQPQEFHSSDLALKEEIQKVTLPIRKSRKVERLCLFLKDRETRGSLKATRKCKKNIRKLQGLEKTATLSPLGNIAIKQKREQLLRRQVAQWQLTKQQKTAFGREFRYLLS